MLLFRLGGDPGAGERAAGKRAAPASGDRCIAAKPWHIRHLAATLGTPCSPPDHSFDAPVQAPTAACGAVPLCEKEARLKLCERGQLFQRTGSVVSNVQIVQWLQEAEPTVNAPCLPPSATIALSCKNRNRKMNFRVQGLEPNIYLGACSAAWKRIIPRFWHVCTWLAPFRAAQRDL